MISDTLPSVTLVRRIKASPAKIWAAITEPDQMVQWWGIDAGPTLSAEADARPGGRFAVTFRMMDGAEISIGGAYQEVVPEQRLVFSWEWPGGSASRVIFTLAPIDGGTELTLVHEQLPDQDARISHERGWNALLDKLSLFLGDA